MMSKNKKNDLKNSSKKTVARKKYQIGKKELFHDIFVTLAIVFSIIFLLTWTVFAVPKVEGYGMSPTVKKGERVFVSRLGRIRRFKLIYFKVPDTQEYSISRVIGLPREEVQYKNDQLFINHQEVPEHFMIPAFKKKQQANQLLTKDFSVSQLPNSQQDRIPAGKYLVLGDNRAYSSDSRYYGLIDEKEVIGTVETSIWPLHKLKSY